MTATNHTITGVIVATVIANPLLALPVALASHLVLDAMPHFGSKELSHTDKKFFYIVGVDAFVAATLLLLTAGFQPTNWLLMVACGVTSASPDLLWLPYWVAELRGRPKKPSQVYRFLGWIQWCERSWGWTFEAVYFCLALILFVPALSS